MAQETLYGVTIDILENQRRTAKSAVAAVRGGYARAYERFDTAWEGGFEKRLSGLNESVKSGLINAEKKFSNSAMNGVNTVAHYLDERLDQAFDFATAQIRGETAHKLYETRAYEAFSRASLPMAKLSLKVSGSVADGVEKLAARIGGEVTATKAHPAKRQAAKRRVVKSRAAKPFAAKARAVKKVAAKTRRRVAAA